MIKQTALIFAALATSANAQPPPYSDIATLEAASAHDVEARISVIDDPMDVGIFVSSEPVYKERGGLFRTNITDHYLRAVIDRRDGSVVFQVIYRIVYDGRYDRIMRATFQTASGPDISNVRELQNETVSCSRFACNRVIAVAIEVPRPVLEWAKDQSVWTVRFVGRYGAQDRLTSPREIAGFLARTDQALATLGK